MLKSITKPLPGLTRCCSICSQRLFPANLEKRRGDLSFHTSMKTDSNKARNVKDKYESPFKRIEEHLVEPLFKEDNQFFNPALDDMKHAEKLFKSHRGHSIQHVKAVIDQEHLPETKISEVSSFPHQFLFTYSCLYSSKPWSFCKCLSYKNSLDYI